MAWNHHLLFGWDARAGVCTYLDLNPHLQHVSCCYSGKLYHPFCHQDRALLAWAHVLFPFHVGPVRLRFVLILSSHYVEDLLIHCFWDLCQCLLCSGILYPWIHSTGILSASHHVIWPLPGHPQPSEIQFHSYNCSSCPNRKDILLQELPPGSSFPLHFEEVEIL